MKMMSVVSLSKKAIRVVLQGVLILYGLNSQAQVSTSRTEPLGFFTVVAGANPNLGINGFIDGYIKKQGPEAFLFPVGQSGLLRPFMAQADGINGAYYSQDPGTASFPSGGPFSTFQKDPSLVGIGSFFWDINGTNGTQISLSWEQIDNIGSLTSNDLGRLTIVGWNATSSRWDIIPSTADAQALQGGSSTVSKGSITTTSAIVPNNYQIYGLGSTGSGPLPVTLVSFNAKLQDNGIIGLDWSTSFEENSSHFEIQRSADGKDWLTLGMVSASQANNEGHIYQFLDDQPLNGVNLYRLKMIDLDLTFSLSRIQQVQIVQPTIYSVYPNPTSDFLHLSKEMLADAKALSIKNTNGIMLYQTRGFTEEGIDIRQFPIGIYVVEILLRSGKVEVSKIMKQ